MEVWRVGGGVNVIEEHGVTWWARERRVVERGVTWWGGERR